MGVMSATDREIVISRVFDAPRDLVYRAWTDPDLMMRWLAPKDFTVLFAEADLRVGGKWRSGMRSPDGTDYFMHGAYRAIVESELLVFTHAWEDDTEPGHEPGHYTLITVTFSDASGGTAMTFHVAGLTSDESRDGQHAGWSQAFDHLNLVVTER